MTSLAPHMEAFLREHLVRHRGASPHTCDSYAYSFQCLFEFASKKLKVTPSALMLEQLDAALVCTFLEHLETTRGNSTETRNVRLAAIRSFFRFLEYREPAAVGQVRRVLAIPFKKADTVWCLIWSRRKCRPCLTLLIHPHGKESEIGPCCILRYAPGSAFQS
jgi:integrase/recombinase XerD